ncbi:SWC3 [Candida pseudojiufengensis]|uniref:SWC3 n=1 Tax=Candida pseudojiufengensis TaxID=497109 RepID=UPI0022257108|nr:SWC3 [Candida pseudojiufengensis]KAI5958999.1 SWC3 [Candida pseudojiufengensis]
MPPRIRRRLTTSKRNEIEKQQELVEQSQQIVRPFETIHSLPVSFSSVSQESSLNQPLTIKDTGVLYLSLIKSRSNYLKLCPMFQLYWVKQSSYIKKLVDQDKPIPEHLKRDDIFANRPSVLNNEVSARDIMIKLVDCGLTIGVHFFEIRVFIAKDERSDTKEEKIRLKQERAEKKLQREKEKLERKAQREQENREREERKRQKELEKQELMMKMRLESEKLKTEAQQPTTSTSNGSKNSIKKETPTKKSSDTSHAQQKPKSLPTQPTTTLTNSSPSPNPGDMKSPENQKMIANLNFIGSKNAEFNNLMTLVAHGVGNSHQIMIFQKYIKKARELKHPPHSDKTIKRVVDSINREIETETRNEVNAVRRQLERGELGMVVQNNGVASKDRTLDNENKNSNIKSESTRVAQNTSTVQHHHQEVNNDKLNDSITAPDPQTQTIKTESRQNQIQDNDNNNSQLSNQTNQEVKQTHSNSITGSVQEPNSLQQGEHQHPQQTQNGYSNNVDLTSPQNNIHHNAPAPSKTKLEMQQELNIKLEPNPYHITSKHSSVEPEGHKSKKQKVQEIPKDQKLTAFQEKYSTNATLVFEFLENTNVRFQLPKYSICEILDPSTSINSENGNASDNKDILVSFLWVHNQKEIDEYEVALKKYNTQMKELEEEKERQRKEIESEEKKETDSEINQVPENGSSSNVEQTKDDKNSGTQETARVDECQEVKKEELNDIADEDNDEVEIKEETVTSSVPAKRRAPPPRRGKKKRRGPVPKKAASKPLQPPEEPTYSYSSVSFTLHGIPSKFVPIFVNSFEPVEKVRVQMEHILKVGTRLAPYQLWYQVDGRLDEDLAENLRVQLNQEEKKFTGIPTVQDKPKKYPKKKKVEPAVGDSKTTSNGIGANKTINSESTPTQNENKEDGLHVETDKVEVDTKSEKESKSNDHQSNEVNAVSNNAEARDIAN